VLRMGQMRGQQPARNSDGYEITSATTGRGTSPQEVVHGVPKGRCLSGCKGGGDSASGCAGTFHPPRERPAAHCVGAQLAAEGAGSLLHDTLEPSSRLAKSRMPSQANGPCLLPPSGGGQGGAGGMLPPAGARDEAGRAQRFGIPRAWP